MKKRIAYVGLSSPIFYDYGNSATKTDNDTMSSPNPILESPFGLMLLYDEIWFLCKSLCPDNMRALTYVNFIDVLFPQIDCSTVSKVYEVEGTKFAKNANPFESYGDLVEKLNVSLIAGRTDNHSHTLRIGVDYESSANSASIETLLFDISIVEHLHEALDKKVELITNSMTNVFFFARPSNVDGILELAEKLTINNIPNYLSKEGPYNSCIEEAREDSNLKAFRKWIIENHAHIDKSEILDIATTVERVITEKKEALFDNYLDTKTYYSAIGETVVGTFSNLLIPYISTICSINKNLMKKNEAQSHQWQGFVSNANKKYFRR